MLNQMQLPTHIHGNALQTCLAHLQKKTHYGYNCIRPNTPEDDKTGTYRVPTML